MTDRNKITPTKLPRDAEGNLILDPPVKSGAVRAASCQCVTCLRYLSSNWVDAGPWECTECRPDFGIPLAKIRGTLTTPLDIECLALLSEECAETQQRVGKIQRWGWEANFDGTTQQHKLESEMGDILAAMSILMENGLVDAYNIQTAMHRKLAKLREDAAGPRQRLLHAKVPEAHEDEYGQAKWIKL